MDVYYTLGRGFLEPVYQEALEIELRRRDIPFEAQKLLRIEYKGTHLKKEYVADFVCFRQIIYGNESLRRPDWPRRGTDHQLHESYAHARWAFAQFRQSGQTGMEALRDLVLFGVCLFLVRESSWIVHLVEQARSTKRPG